MENLNRFYDWMLKMGSIHLADNARMSRAFEVIAESDAQVAKKVIS